MLYGNRLLRNIVAAISLGILLASCEPQNPDENLGPILTGVFLDSAVSGLTYSTNSVSGITNRSGEFEYREDEILTFSIGGIVLGEAVGAAILTPVEIVLGATDHTDPAVINILRLLQSLDEDSYPANGITISDTTTSLAENIVIDVNVPVDTFSADSSLNAFILLSTGSSGLVEAADAQQHYQEQQASETGVSLYSVGGNIFGLSADLILNNNSTDLLTVSANGSFSFSELLVTDDVYGVVINTQPAGQNCTIQNSTGTITANDVIDIIIICSDVQSSYSISGAVSGLQAGVLQNLVIANNDTDALTISDNGLFTFSLPVEAGAAYNVSIQSQPTDQVCAITNGSSLATQNIINVEVNCVDAIYTVAGIVSGLASGIVAQDLVLQNNGADNLTVTANGSFQFAQAVAGSIGYDVTIQAQRTGQTCSVTAGSASSFSQNVTNINIACLDNTYSVGGNVNGLSTGPLAQDLVVLINGTEQLTLTNNGPFDFISSVSELDGYNVAIQTQPTSQTCSVANGSASSITSNVSNVEINCASNAYTISGSVNGLSGVITLQNNDSDDLILSADGTFTFTSPVAEGFDYNVIVLTNPVTQRCSVINGTGTNLLADVADVSVTCENSYSIGGIVTGLASGTVAQDLVLLNNGADALTITSNGSFLFNTRVLSADGYDITIQNQRSGQLCNVTNAVAATVNQDITNISVDCISQFTVGGAVSGLTGTLVLQNNGVDDLTLTTDGLFEFSSVLDEGTAFAVSVLTQPSAQTCVLSNETSTGITQNVTNVQVNCGNLLADVVYLDAGFETCVNSNASTNNWVFVEEVTILNCDNSGAAYNINNPADASQFTNLDQLELAHNPLVNADQSLFSLGLSYLNVAPNDKFPSSTISVQVSGLNPAVNTDFQNALVLGDAQFGDLGYTPSITTTTTTNFNYSDGFWGYDIVVNLASAIPAHNCTINNPNLGVIFGDMSPYVITVDCVEVTYTISGTVTGLEPGSILLFNNGGLNNSINGGDELTISADGAFTFLSQVNETEGYNVSVQTQPAGKLCTVVNGVGFQISTNINSIDITCAPSVSISGNVYGLNGVLVLQNNDGDDLIITADFGVVYSSSFTFSTPVLSGGEYNVTILSAPESQDCNVVLNGSATNVVSDINDLSIECFDKALLSDVSVSDINLANCISSATIGLTYVDELTTLTCANLGIESISGISSFKSIVSLDLSDNFILHIDSLSYLESLEYLNLAGNPIPTIQSVADFMMSGTAWELGRCVQEHIRVGRVVSVDQLTELDCSYRGIDSLAHLQKLRYLKKLDLSGNTNLFFASDISDINYPYYDNDYSSLQRLNTSSVVSSSPLEVLNLDSTRLDTLHWVKGFKNLKNLNISNNHVIDLTPLDNIPSKLVRGGFSRSPGKLKYTNASEIGIALEISNENRPRYLLEVIESGDLNILLDVDYTVPNQVSNTVLFYVLDEAGNVIAVSPNQQYSYQSPLNINLAAGMYTIVVGANSTVDAFQYSIIVSQDSSNSLPGDANFISSLKYLGISPCNGCQQVSDLTPLSNLHNIRHIDLRNNTAISDVSSLSQLSNLTNVGIASSNISIGDLPGGVESGLSSTINVNSDRVIKANQTFSSSILITESDVVGLTANNLLLNLNIVHPSPQNISISLNFIPFDSSIPSSNQVVNHSFSSNYQEYSIDLVDSQEFFGWGDLVSGVLEIYIVNSSDYNGKLTNYSFVLDNGISKSLTGLGLVIEPNQYSNYYTNTSEYMITGTTWSNYDLVADIEYPLPDNLLYVVDQYNLDGFNINITNDLYDETGSMYGIINGYSLYVVD